MDQFVADGAGEIASRAPRELEALVAVSSPSGRRRGRRAGDRAVRGVSPAAGRGRTGAVLDPGERRGHGGADRRPGLGPDAAARPSGHGHRARLARAAAARRRSALRPRHGRHEGRCGAVAGGGAGAGRAPRDVRRADGAAGHRRGVAPARVSPHRAVRSATTRACASRAASSPRTGTRAWSCTARPRERCAWSQPAARRIPEAPPTRAATRCWRSRQPRSRSRGITTRTAPSGSAWFRPWSARATRSMSCRPTGELLFDMRADRSEAFDAVCAAVPDELDGVGLETEDAPDLAGDGLAGSDARRCSSTPPRGSGVRSSAARAAEPATPAISRRASR